MNIEKMEANASISYKASFLKKRTSYSTLTKISFLLIPTTVSCRLQISSVHECSSLCCQSRSRTNSWSEQSERQYSTDAAYLQRKEVQQAAAFDNQQSIIDSLRAQGAALARGQAGRSAAKVQQAEAMAFGRDQAILAASLSADENLQTTIRDINLAYETANMQAEANCCSCHQCWIRLFQWLLLIWSFCCHVSYRTLTLDRTN